MVADSGANLQITFKLAIMAFLGICNRLKSLTIQYLYCKILNTGFNYSQAWQYFNTFCQKVTHMRQFSDKR
jgi:hypothetical protein